MERKQGYGRTITTAPIQDSRSRPAQSATADYSGVAEFGRALQGVGGNAMRVAGGIQNEADRVAAEQKNNLAKQTLAGLELNLREAVLNVEMTTENWSMMDDKQRAQVLTPLVKDWEKSTQVLAAERGIEVPGEWVRDTALNHTVNQLKQGRMIYSANMLAERVDTEMKSLNLRINTTETAEDLLAALDNAPNGFTSTSTTYLSSDNQNDIVRAGYRHGAERAVSFAKRGAITEEQIVRGLERGFWDNSQADAMRAGITSGGEVSRKAIEDDYRKTIETVSSGAIGSEVFDSPTIKAKTNLIIKDAGTDVELAKRNLNTFGREVQRAIAVGKLSEALLNNKGLSYGVTSWKDVQAALGALSEPETRRTFLSPYLKEGKFGEYTDAELAETSAVLSTNYARWVKDIENGLAYRKFANDVTIQDFVRNNPDWMNMEGGWKVYTDVMRQVQEGAGIPDQYVNTMPEEIMVEFKAAALSPEKLGPTLRKATHPVTGIGKEMNSLIQGLVSDEEFMKTSAGQGLVGGLVPVSMAMNMETNDENVGTVMEMTASLAQDLDWANRGGEKTFNELIPTGKTSLQNISLVMSGSLAKEAGSIRDPSKVPMYAEGMDTRNNLIAGLQNTYSPEVASAVDKAIMLDAMRRSNGSPDRLVAAYAEAYSAMTAGMKVIVANGTQRSDSSKDYIVVPSARERRGFMRQPDGTTIGTQYGDDYGTSTSLSLDAFSTPDFDVLEPMATAPATTMAVRYPALGIPLVPAIAVDFFRGKAPFGAMESMWNQGKASLAQNWFGVSVENSRMPSHSLLNKDPELMALVPAVFRPDAATLVLERFDNEGRESLVHVSTGKPIPKGLPAAMRQQFTEVVEGYATAKDRDLRALTVAQNITWKYNADGNFYAYLKPGKSNDGQIVLPTSGAAPQQLFHIVNGVKTPMAIPKKVLDMYTAFKESRSGSPASSFLSPTGSVRAYGGSPFAIRGPLLEAAYRAPLDQFKASLEAEAEVFVRTQRK